MVYVTNTRSVAIFFMVSALPLTPTNSHSKMPLDTHLEIWCNYDNRDKVQHRG